MAEYRLYCFAQSGNAYKAALMLALCNAEWEPRFVDFLNGETRTPEYRAINVMGEVPILEHGTLRLTQSGVILTYLAERFGKFGGTDAESKREVLRWLFWDNHKLTSYTATLRFMVAYAKTGETPVTEFFRARLKGALGVLDGHLATHRFAIGDAPSIADLSMCGYLYWPEEFGLDWAEYPHIKRWLADIAALPGWVHPYTLMPGHPLPEKD
ncbi:MAG: glutathione S-transferase [Casimicrobiaceae bacterium]